MTSVSSDTRVLIINADDLGFTDGVTRGIIEAHRAGAVTSASLMVNTPGFARAIEAIRSVPELGVGLHLNLTVGFPLIDAALLPSFTDAPNGRFLPLRRLAGRTWRGAVDPGELRREIVAQFSRASDAGIHLTHVDGHQHTHRLPCVLPVVRDVAKHFGVSRVRETLEPLSHRMWRVRATFVKLFLRTAHVAQSRSESTPPLHFRGISLQGDHRFAQRLAEDLASLPLGTTELIVHPGYPDALLASLDNYLEPRRIEHAALTSEPILSLLKSLPIRLATFATA